MSKCIACRKDEAVNTRWERFRFKLMQYLFAEDVAALTQEKFTQGFGEGRRVGYKQCMNQSLTEQEAYQELVKEGLGSWLEKFEPEKASTVTIIYAKDVPTEIGGGSSAAVIAPAPDSQPV
jgi:hypothetical protein